MVKNTYVRHSNKTRSIIVLRPVSSHPHTAHVSRYLGFYLHTITHTGCDRNIGVRVRTPGAHRRPALAAPLQRMRCAYVRAAATTLANGRCHTTDATVLTLSDTAIAHPLAVRHLARMRKSTQCAIAGAANGEGLTELCTVGRAAAQFTGVAHESNTFHFHVHFVRQVYFILCTLYFELCVSVTALWRAARATAPGPRSRALGCTSEQPWVGPAVGTAPPDTCLGHACPPHDDPQMGCSKFRTNNRVVLNKKQILLNAVLFKRILNVSLFIRWFSSHARTTRVRRCLGLLC